MVLSTYVNIIPGLFTSDGDDGDVGDVNGDAANGERFRPFGVRGECNEWFRDKFVDEDGCVEDGDC